VCGYPTQLALHSGRRHQSAWQPEAGLKTTHVDSTTDPLGKVFPAGREEAQPFGLRESAPDPVGFPSGKCMGGTLGPDGTRPADRLGGHFPSEAGRAPLAVGMEELSTVPATARTVALPVPDVGRWTRQPAHTRHGLASRTDGRRTPAERTPLPWTSEQTKSAKVRIG